MENSSNSICRSSNMQRWPDADVREAFVREIDTNFSLIAPAGVGKTQSIVQRVLEIARCEPDSALPRLVVVTYTRRAASEMQDRVYVELLASGAAPQVFAAMDRVFFGTIHAFCARLLQLYGIHIGLPTGIQLSPDATQLWKEFLFSLEGEKAVEAGMEELGGAKRYYRIQDLFTEPPPDEMRGGILSAPPFKLDFSELLSENQFLEVSSHVRENVREGQRLATEWLKKFRSDVPYLPLPRYAKGGKKFLMAWEFAFDPLRQWIKGQVQRAVCVIASKYQDWRLRQGRLLYADQVAFTLQLLRHPRVGPILREQHLSVILDEAQDTDPLQFEVLFGISEGRISLVGDPQQSIYGSRADLQVYQQFQKRVCEAPQGKELQYQVSFRCRKTILNFVNQAGPGLLDGENGQVKFVPLQSACEGDSGQVIRLPFSPPASEPAASAAQAKEFIAHEVAVWLRKVGLDALRARDWSEVAILCPRKRWLETLAIFLRREGFRVQIHSERSLLGDSPVYAWWTSLFWVLTHPIDFFEVAGLLREVFAVQDSDLASLCEGDPSRLYPNVSASLPPLRLLGELVEEVKNLPLRSAVDLVLCRTSLLARLFSLPGEDSLLLRNRYNELLTQASEAEVKGLTLSEFAQELRDHFECASESPPVLPGTIQLMTCQKAKGLEWDAVIVPYLSRKISFRMAHSPVYIFDEERLFTSRLQETQRLLYVTLTRARNTLVLVDDRTFFSSKEKTKTFSFAEILGQEGLEAFEALPTQATAGTVSQISLQSEISPTEVSCSWWENSRRLALQFPHKITPHSLVQNISFPPLERREGERESLAEGREYGIWWHECAEVLPLNQPNWLSYLEELWEKCPDYERGRREWEIFSQTTLAERFIREKCLFYREMPFFLPEGSTVIEGVMDLAAFYPEKHTWLLVDWKTDRDIQPAEFLSRYGAQLGAYARCLRELTAAREVEAGLYAVSLGQWIPLKKEGGEEF